MVKAAKKVQSVSSPQFLEVQPNAARTLLALREMGYDSFSAIADLIDNAIDAGAKKVSVVIREAGEDRVIEIQDDGKGMDEKVLAEALRLGSNIEHLDPKKRLGKYGMGLVTASLSLARNIWVLSREKGKTAFEATFDLATIERENRFVITLRPAESKKVIETIDEHGTLVRLSMIDRIKDRNVARFAADLRKHLGQVYRHYLALGFSIVVNRTKVERFDPLYRDHPETVKLLEQTIDLHDGTRASIIAVELPAEIEALPHESGFYVVRNQREIISANTFGFYRHHHSYSGFRCELSYRGDSTAFHEDVKKSSVHPDERVVKKLSDLTAKLIAEVGRRSRDRAEAVPVKLYHRSAEEVINEKLAVLVQGPTKDAVKAAKEATLNPPPVQAPEEKPKGKRGRPTKEEAERRKAEEAAAEKAKLEAPPAPTVEYREADTGDGRFYTAEQQDVKLVITYNTTHPLVRMVADAKHPNVSKLLGMMSFALAKAEADVPDGKKLVNRACDYLAVLAAPGGAA